MPRSLLIDLPLGMVLGVAAVGTARFSGWARAEGFGADGPGRGPQAFGPPWQAAESLGALSWWLVPVAALLVVAVALRRQRPRLGFALGTLGGAGYLALGYPHGPVLAVLALTAYVVAARHTSREWWPWSLLVVPMLLAGAWPGPQSLAGPEFYAGVVTTLAVTGVALAVGTVRRTRGETTAAERELAARRYAYQERLRIARDVHDVVGHSLSVITMQAGVALHVAQRRPEQVEESLRAIRTTSANALAELRATLDTFRDPDFGPGAGADVDLRAPQPGLAQVDGLVDSLASAGRTVTVERAVGRPTCRSPWTRRSTGSCRSR